MIILPSLADTLHESYMSCGEVRPPDAIAEIVIAWEKAKSRKASPVEIFQATWEAADSFVDSMQGNAMDNGASPDSPEVTQWEKFRPSAVRKAEILKLLSI